MMTYSSQASHRTTGGMNSAPWQRGNPVNKGFLPGQVLYLACGGHWIETVTYIHTCSDRCLVATETGGAIRVSHRRLFQTHAEAEGYVFSREKRLSRIGRGVQR